MSLPLTFKECLDQGETLLGALRSDPNSDRTYLKAIALHLRALVIQQSTENLKLVMDHADHLLRHPMRTAPVFVFRLLPMPTGVMVQLDSRFDIEAAYINLKPLIMAGWTVQIRGGGDPCPPNEHESSDKHPLCERCGIALQ